MFLIYAASVLLLILLMEFAMLLSRREKAGRNMMHFLEQFHHERSL
jgi:hypothetical protein